jgi:ELWxxDGT repeat protein
LLFYGDNGDNTNPDTSGDGLFMIQNGALWLLKIINSSGKSQVQDFTPLGEKFIFSACNALGCEPWITDGTPAGTTLLVNLNLIGDSNPQEYTLFDGAIYFAANDGVHGVELWRTDGTEVGTVLVKNIGIENDSLLPLRLINGDPHDLTVFGDHLYFVANDVDYQGYGAGVELWRSDGTEAGTVIVKNVAIEDPNNLPNDPDTPIDSSPNQLTVFNGALYFVATDGRYGTERYGIELWKSDGTEANTNIVKDIGIDPVTNLLPYDALPEQLTAFDGELYFFADDGTTGFEPWRTDGTEVNTVQVANVGIDASDPFPTAPDNLTYWTEAQGWLFFTAEDGFSGVEPWRTDGLSTSMVLDINPFAGDSVVPGRDDVFTTLNGQLLFFANDGTHGFEPWLSDGTFLGTRLLADIYSTPINNPTNADGLTFLTEYQRRSYFTANDGLTGREIWTTDGTTVDTRFLKDIGPGYESGYSDAFGPSILDGRLFFSAFDGGINVGHGVEMWQTLGNETDTRLVEDLNPGAQNDGVLKAVPLPLP